MMIAGFADVDEGAILVDGVDIAAHAAAASRLRHGVPELRDLSAPERLRERRLSAARAALPDGRRSATGHAGRSSSCGSARFADRFARQLSGGQQQRVAIARAIVFQPRVVLMDEPLGALDKNLRYEMQVEIKEIQRRLGMTVIYVTHDQEEAMNMSDRIAIMNRGRIEQVGAPGEIYERPANAFVARFLGEANLIDGTVESARCRRRDACDAGGLVSAARACRAPTCGPAPRLICSSAPSGVAIAPARRGAAWRRQPRTWSRARLLQTSFLGNILRYAVEIEPAIAGHGRCAELARRTCSARPTGTATLSWLVDGRRRSCSGDRDAAAPASTTSTLF